MIAYSAVFGKLRSTAIDVARVLGYVANRVTDFPFWRVNLLGLDGPFPSKNSSISYGAPCYSCLGAKFHSSACSL